MGSRVKLASIESVARSLQAVGRPQDLRMCMSWSGTAPSGG
jgi:hypothetical protein